MYKSKIFVLILRFISWITDRRQEIYFIIMAIFILSAVGFGVNRFIYYTSHPMFNNPSTIVEHFALPIFISMLSIVLILLFGIFFTHFLTFIPFKKLKIFKMEMEFETTTLREKQIANQFLYSSTMLHNHTENVKYLMDNQLLDLQQVLQFLAESYKNYYLEYNEELAMQIDVLKPSELKEEENKLFKAIDQQSVKKTNTTYINRLLKGENLLVGIVNVEEGGTNKVAIVVRRGYEYPFDIYDQETLESIIGYAAILFDTTVMIKLFQDNDMFDQGKEANDED